MSASNIVQKQVPQLLSPTLPTPIGPPLVLSPLDVAMINSRIDLVWLYLKPTGKIKLKQLSKSRSGDGREQQKQLSSASSVSRIVVPGVDVDTFMPLTRLMSSLRTTLSDYHPACGRLIVDNNSYAIRCSDEGCSWITAYCSLRLDSFLPSRISRRAAVFDNTKIPSSLLTPLPSSPFLNNPLLQIQYTRFQCGSVSLGLSFYHALMDAESAFLFMQAWSLECRGANKNLKPSHERPLVTAMAERIQDYYNHDEYRVIEKKRSSIPASPVVVPTPPPSSPPPQINYNTSPPFPPIPTPMNYLSLKLFHFTSQEIEGMMNNVIQSQSSLFASGGIGSPRSVATSAPTQMPTAVVVDQIMSPAPPPPPPLLHHHSLNSYTHSTNPPIQPPPNPQTRHRPTSSYHLPPTIVSSMNRSSSAPNSPRPSLSSTSSSLSAGTSPFDPTYLTPFDLLCAHWWQLIFRARSANLLNDPLSNAGPTPISLGESAVTISPSSPSPLVRPPSIRMHRRTLTGAPLNSVSENPGASDSAFPSSSSSSSLTPLTRCGIAFNGRNRLDPPLPNVFCGCVTFFAAIDVPMSSLLSLDLSTLARCVRDRMKSMVDEYLRSALAFLSRPISSELTIIPAFQTKTKDILVVNWSRSPVYVAEFVDGVPPEWVGLVCPAPILPNNIPTNLSEMNLTKYLQTMGMSAWEGYVSMMPGCGDEGSMDVTVCLNEEEMKRVENDPMLHFFLTCSTNSSSDPTRMMVSSGDESEWEKGLSGSFGKLDVKENRSHLSRMNRRPSGHSSSQPTSPTSNISPTHFLQQQQQQQFNSNTQSQFK